jgi:hypothetical protein
MGDASFAGGSDTLQTTTGAAFTLVTTNTGPVSIQAVSTFEDYSKVCGYSPSVGQKQVAANDYCDTPSYAQWSLNTYEWFQPTIGSQISGAKGAGQAA